MSEKLANCPFCGSPAELEHDNDHHGSWFNLGCSQHWGRVKPVENACIGGRLFYTEEPENEAKAIEAWNRRHQDQDNPSEFERMLSK